MLPVASVITWLDSHQGAASGFLTVVLICVTIFYAIQNRYMVKEMRRSRELSIANREREEHRERLRDLRSVTDEATAALRDLWSILGTFMYAIPRGDPPVSRKSPTEARKPDPQAFIDAYQRLTDAHLRLLNRVEWGDTFHSPVGRAVSDAQAAFNAVVYEDPYALRDKQSDIAISKALGSAQHGLRELQETSRQRFAPLGLPDSRYTAVLVLKVKRAGSQTDEILAKLRGDPMRRTKVTGPDNEGRFVVRDDEAAPSEARQRLIMSLNTAANDWANYLELLPPSKAEATAWARRAAAKGQAQSRDSQRRHWLSRRH